jgi:hypothetical protein
MLGLRAPTLALALLDSAIVIALVRIDHAGADRRELLDAMCALSGLQLDRVVGARHITVECSC